MLIMKCPKCLNYIRSDLLVELKVIDCEHCKVQVPVANVLVSSNGFTFERNDLLKRFYRYRKLLDEVIEERNSLSSNSGSSDISLRSIEKFMNVLQGMMAGARDHYRCAFAQPLSAKLRYLQQEFAGSIYNLSMDGACVEISSRNPLPRVKGVITLTFNLPGQVEKLIVTGEICWTHKGVAEDKKGHSSGIRFSGMDEVTRNALWYFISTTAQQKKLT